jgi:alkylation response protein AidB-like acyl-CoA dehydrogenase
VTVINHDVAGLERARRIADEVLFPAAPAVDLGKAVPASHLDLLAEQGFYGLAAPPGLNRLDLPDFPAVCRAVETLAGGCLTTTFVWAQHHSAVMAAANTGNEALREIWLAPLAAGERRAGLAIGAAVRPGPAALTAEQVPGGWLLTGEAPWVSGWGAIDTLYVAARDADDVIVWALLDTVTGDTLSAVALELAAVNASRTVTVHFRRHFVPDERVTGRMPLAEWTQRDPSTLRFNGSLALGVAGRAIDLLGDPPAREALAAQLTQARARLDKADGQSLPGARAGASELALRASAALVVSQGSRAALADQTAARLLREAGFLLVFGSRPGIRAALESALVTARDPARPA